MNEFQLIARYFASSPCSNDVLLGIGDDAAVIAVPSGYRLVAAVDTIVEGIHFPHHSDAADIAYRALAVNLSDMAAMGAVPRWFTLSLCIPAIDEAWMEHFASSLQALAGRFDVQLVGGDTVKGPLNISIQILGLVESDKWLTRSGASPGDLIFVSGNPGEAAGGLQLLLTPRGAGSREEQQYSQHLIQRFLRPEPRVALGRFLRLHASAAMDVSDGLLGDLRKLCASSGCGARLQLEQLPASSALQVMFDDQQREQLILSGGDDYELLFTIAPQHEAVVARAMAACDVVCTRIGVMSAGPEVSCFRDSQAVTFADAGYDHFAS
ncbi:MAG: thiamine-phosphate kinase [Steroidobacter sp.]